MGFLYSKNIANFEAVTKYSEKYSTYYIEAFEKSFLREALPISKLCSSKKKKK